MTNTETNSAFNETGPKLNFFSTDWKCIFRSSEVLFYQTLNNMPDDDSPESFFGLSAGQVKERYYEAQDVIQAADGRLWSAREKLKDCLNNNELAAVMHLENVRGLLKAGAHIMAERNLQNEQNGQTEIFDRKARRQKIIERLETEKALGADKKTVWDRLNILKIWTTFTPHPTKDKNDPGEFLFRLQTFVAENYPHSRRSQPMQDIIQDMLKKPLSPREKDTLRKENEDGLKSMGIYMEGILNYTEDLQFALDTVHGKNAICLTDPDMGLDLAPRDWYSGDADGKEVSAPVLFAKRVRSAHMAVECYLKDLSQVDLDDPDLTDEEQAQLEKTIAVFKQFKNKLDALERQLEQIENSKSDSDLFKDAKKNFVKIFIETSYNGDTFKVGPELTSKVMDDLQALLQTSKSESFKRAAFRTIMRHKQVGIAMSRQEIRHNGDDYKVMFDKLFDYLREHNLVDIPNNLKDIETFSEQTPIVQAKFLVSLMQEHQDKVKTWLEASNADGWHREILERFKVMSECFNHNRMGSAIIAEADEMSTVLQQVLAESYGIKNMIHTALNEDENTIKHAARNLRFYRKKFGAFNIEKQIEQLKDIAKKAFAYLGIMAPQSDSNKSYGLWIKPLQSGATQALIRIAVRFITAILEKLGTGASYARGGFSPKIVPRMFLYNLSALWDITRLKERFFPEQISVLKQMASFVSTTIQGRAVGYQFGTAKSVYDTISGIDAEITAVHLAIDGNIAPELVAPLAVRYSQDMQDTLSELEQECRNEYNKMRTRKNPDNEEELWFNIVMKKISALFLSEKANTGARKDQRSEASNKDQKPEPKPVDELRAIGCNIAIANSELYFDGAYTLGLFMEKLHKVYKKNVILRQDLTDFRNDAFYFQQVFPNAMAALASANYEHAFDQLSQGEKEWTVQQILEVHENKYKNLDKHETFVAVLAYDALKATAYMHALQETQDVKPPTPQKGILRKNFFRADKSSQPLEQPKTGFDLPSEKDIILSLYKQEDRLHELKFSDKLRSIFPDLDSIITSSKDQALSRAIVHETEQRIRNYGIELSNPVLHHIACARRSFGPINMENLLDRSGFGHRKEPLFDIIRKKYLQPQRQNVVAFIGRLSGFRSSSTIDNPQRCYG